MVGKGASLQVNIARLAIAVADGRTNEGTWQNLAKFQKAGRLC